MNKTEFLQMQLESLAERATRLAEKLSIEDQPLDEYDNELIRMTMIPILKDCCYEALGNFYVHGDFNLLIEQISDSIHRNEW